MDPLRPIMPTMLSHGFLVSPLFKTTYQFTQPVIIGPYFQHLALLPKNAPGLSSHPGRAPLFDSVATYHDFIQTTYGNDCRQLAEEGVLLVYLGPTPDQLPPTTRRELENLAKEFPDRNLAYLQAEQLYILYPSSTKYSDIELIPNAIAALMLVFQSQQKERDEVTDLAAWYNMPTPASLPIPGIPLSRQPAEKEVDLGCAYAIAYRGGRPNFEDRFKIFLLPDGRKVLIVADGMGRDKKGAEAADLAVSATSQHLRQCDGADYPATFQQAADQAKATIVEYSKTGLLPTEEMGTTLVMAIIVGNQLHYAYIGDSRLYLISPEGSVELVTQDHSPGFDASLAYLGTARDGNLIAFEEAIESFQIIFGSPIYRAITSSETESAEVDYGQLTLADGDWAMLCSDGLNNALGPQLVTLLQACRKEGLTIKQAAAKLAEAIEVTKGTDNVTIVLYQHGG